MANKGVFNLNTPLYKVRFIHIPPNNVDLLEIQSSFQRFNKNDRSFLDSLSFQFNNYLLADSIWLKKRDLISEVNFLNQQNIEKFYFDHRYCYIVVLPKSWFMRAHIFLTYLGRPALKKIKIGEKL